MLFNPLKIFLSCVIFLLAQSASSQQNFKEKYEGVIAAFEAADKINPPRKNSIVFIGSSSIVKWNSLKTDFPGKSLINRGFGGSHTEAVAHYVNRVIIPYAPKQVVIYVGDNDIAAGKTVETVFNDLKTLFAAIRSGLPKATISFISIKPSPSRWKYLDRIKQVNSLVKNQLATMQRTQYIDIFTPMLNAAGRPEPDNFLSDSLHMSPAGYVVWTKALKPYLK